MIVVMWRAWGAPLGEPFADDFSFLHHGMFGAFAHWMDGGGAVIYWRPLSRQLYFEVLGPLMLSHPRIVAGLHAVLLAAVGLLVFRALRTRWSGPWSAAAASFPVIAEANRTLLLWPTAFQDLGALLGVAIALHEASRRRLATALAAVVAALLCKESALVGALLLPWIPWIRGGNQRRGWVVATLIAVAVWSAFYAYAFWSSGVQFQRHLESLRPAMPIRLVWATVATSLDVLSLGAVPAWLGKWLALGFGLLIAGAVVWALRPSRRAVLRENRAWIVWGAVWFAASTALLSEVFPLWGPFRSTFGMLGLGIALTPVLGTAGRWALIGSAGLRLTLLAVSAGPPSAVAQMPYQAGAAFDFASLSRLSRFTLETRAALLAAAPTLPPGATVSWRLRPQMTQYAFAGDKALHVWYRDTTLAWANWDDVQGDSSRRLDVTLEYQAHQNREVVALAPQAVEAFREGTRRLAADATSAALASFARSDSLQVDRGATSFLGAIAGKRALCRLIGGDVARARQEAKRSLEEWPEGGDARYVLAVTLALGGSIEQALVEVDTLLEHYPFDASALALRDSLRARRGP